MRRPGSVICPVFACYNWYITKLSEGASQGGVEALRLAAKLLGLGCETSPSAVANSMAFFIST